MAASIFCPRCGLSSADDAQFCQRCGATLAPLPAALPADEPRYAGFWIRVAAAIIDTIALLCVLFPIRLLLGSATTVIGMDLQMPTHGIFLTRRIARIAIGIAIAWVYKAGSESCRYQATFGKMAMHLKVTDLQGNRISFGRATARYFAKYLSTLALMIGYLMIAFDEHKQGLHDQIAGTLVQYRQNSFSPGLSQRQ